MIEKENSMRTIDILHKVQSGELSPAEAQELLAASGQAVPSTANPLGAACPASVPSDAEMNDAEPGYAEMGFAKPDIRRRERTGFSEVVYCQGKPDEYLADIWIRLYEQNGEVLGTRATKEQYLLVRRALEAIHAEAADRLQYDSVSRILKLEKPDRPLSGLIAVCSAGTADIPVAEEAAAVAEFFGSRCERIYDIGVSGIHRLFSQLPRIRAANCVIAVAGMEGALVSVLGGLVERPVIAVPTSIGYGVGAGGQAALHAMLSTCANGVAVVNIDNGFGAGYIATQINRLAGQGVKENGAQ